MRKAFNSGAIAAAISSAKMADAKGTQHDNGTISTHLSARQTDHIKHGNFINGEGLFEQEIGILGRASESVFGEYETEFQKQLREYHEAKEMMQHKKLGQGKSFPSILNNEDGFMWTGEIYMGKLSKMDIVYDTGSDWLVVESSTCTNCEGNTYDIQPSLDTGDAVALSEENSERSYGSAFLIGKEYTDTVCILFSACVDNFQFFMIEQQVGIQEPIDGIMGMARNKPLHLTPELGNKSGPLYMEALYSNGIIDQNTFSFYYTEAGKLSWVDLGSPDLENVREGSEVSNIQFIEEDFFYGQYCQGVAFGDTNVENTMVWGTLSDYTTEVDNSFYTILDTGATALMISNLYFEAFVTQIFDRLPGVAFEFKNNRIFTECSADFPPLFFMFDEHWLEVDAKDYVYEVDGDGTCLLFILPTDLPMNVLGMPIFVDYYSMHNPETGVIGFAPHDASTKQDIVRGTIPPKDQYLGIGKAEVEIDNRALLMSWAFTGLVVYLVGFWYIEFLMESWYRALNQNAFYVVSGLFFSAISLAALFILQPIIFNFVQTQLEDLVDAASTTSSTARVSANTMEPKNFDISVYAATFGFLFAMVLRKYFYRP